MYNINIGNQGKIMRKLLGGRTTESSSAGVTSSPLAIARYRPVASQDAVYPAGDSIGCIDKSPDGASAVLAGRHILKTINVSDGLRITEGIDLRALLNAQPAKSNASTSVADQLSIKDVKWGTGTGNTAIFTACASGKIFRYDLARLGSAVAGDAAVESIQIREDSRQVNALDINPHRGTLLLSGSQDGIVRCFDIREPITTRTGLTFRAISAFKCNADGVRRVQWSPKDGMMFACGTEQGAVLKWDMRKPSAPMLRINAHERTCSSIAWHPDGEHLVSAGYDSKCQIWDMSKTADKRQKPKYTISTPAPVAALAWRPGQWSVTAQAKRASQLAVSYDEVSQKRFGVNAVHIWDIARPTMPYREIQRFDSSPSAMLWHDQYLLWTAGQDGFFNQWDVTYAPKVIDRQAVSTLAFSPQGNVLMFLDERAPSSHRPRPHMLHPDMGGLPSYSSSPATPRFSVSRSDSEDDAMGSFLGPKRRGGAQKRRATPRSANPLSTTPPTGSGVEAVLSLDQTIKVTGTYKPQQAMAIGHVPSAAKVDVYEYLSANYLETLHSELPYSPGGRAMPDRVAAILEHYAKAAEYVNQFRLAQTWRILAYGIDLVLRRRAQYHLECRMRRLRGLSCTSKSMELRPAPLGQPFEVSVNAPLDGEETPRKIMSTTSLDKAGMRPRSLLSEELESTSNVPTPLARPVSDDPDGAHIYESTRGKKLTPILEPESFTLPPAVQSHSHSPLHSHSSANRKRLDSTPMSTTSQDSETSQASMEGYDFYDTETLSHAIDVPLSRPKAEHTAAFGQPGSPNRRRKPLRHDSDESFAQMFSASIGSRQASELASLSDGARAEGQPVTTPGATEPRTASESDGGVFASRIRGKQIENSPRRSNDAPFRPGLQRHDTNLTEYTDEHHMITQTTSGSYGSPYPSQTDANFSFESPQRRPPSIEVDKAGDDARSPYIIEGDYLCRPSDPDYPHPVDPSPAFSPNSAPPLQPYSLIARALAFEVKTSALNASAIVLLLKPLIPDDVVDSFQASAILRQHHSRLMSMRLFVEATLLRKMCMKGWPGGVLSDWGDNYPAIFTPAQQGVQVGFFCSSCRKPREVDRTSGSTESVWRCERCRAAMAPCAICGHRDATSNLPGPAPTAHPASSKHAQTTNPQEPILQTWWICPGCSHGGHASCLQAWHATYEAETRDSLETINPPSPDSSGGCCPLDGCGHACLPGRWRAEIAATRMEEVSRAVREATNRAIRTASGAEFLLLSGNGNGGGAEGVIYSVEQGIRTDGGDVVAQSKAVESARETLAGGVGIQGYGGGPRGAPGTGILSSSPGRGSGGGERERRKSVKFVGTDERR
ncbi:hypothetical protein B0T22DRAFT_401241 [Podospora appendiculata]|uniref:WD repeat-containing protein n=1 Tax=Podospora appendiculata TaxID=314037 RepID=A0AAE0XHE4_9PEZI|nr:hypothetical protein B0T22DRAFT_401241 [Podospora appendiculata]